MQEPSVLDYLKSIVFPWKYPAIPGIDKSPEVLPEPGAILADQSVVEVSQQSVGESSAPSTRAMLWPWRSMLGLFLAILAQRSLEPGINRTYTIGVALYIIAAVFTGWASWRSDWQPAAPPESENRLDPITVRRAALIAGFVFAILTFLTSRNNLFTTINVSFLMLSMASWVYAFWYNQFGWREKWNIVRAKLSPAPWSINISPWVLFALVSLGAAAYFRFAHLDSVPPEMNSDHAEKLLDAMRILIGQALIFFPNNGGREPLEMYLLAGMNRFLGVEFNFMALKIVSTGIGFLSLPFFYLIGKEIANPRVGWFAFAFAGVAYWPNVVSRLGLRLPFYILFTAAGMYFLLRGLRTKQRNNFILLGITLGLSMYGYSADRVLPLLILLAIVLFILHEKDHKQRTQAIWFGLLALVIAGILFLPMLRYLLEQPDAFLNRILTRMSGVEQPLTAPAGLIFLRNLGRALAMFSWSNGEIWTVSIPFRPALDIATGGLFWTGVIITAVAYLKRRNWLYLFLLLSIPTLMLPSIMALAFPSENPSLYRTGGAMVPVFLLVATSLDGFMTSLESNLSRYGKYLAWSTAILLLLFSAYQSHGLVFNQYRQQYELSAWNTSEIGQTVRDFSGTFGTADNVWVMGFPHWVDTRLVAIISGYPQRDFAMFIDRLGEIPDTPDAKMFILRPDDQAAIEALEGKFPDGILSTYTSRVPTKDFMIFFVPPERSTMVGIYGS